MGIPFRQAAKIGSYVVKQHLTGVKRYPLGLMLEQLTGYRFAEYVHWIQYAHIYVNQLPAVEEMLAREPRPLPTLQLTAAGRQIDDIHDFRAEHFELTDYDPHPAIAGIPVAT